MRCFCCYCFFNNEFQIRVYVRTMHTVASNNWLVVHSDCAQKSKKRTTYVNTVCIQPLLRKSCNPSHTHMSYCTILAYCAQLEKTQTLAHIFTRYINKVVIHTILRTESGFHHIITNNNKKKRGQLARLVLGLYDTPLWLRRRMRWGPIVKSRS